MKKTIIFPALLFAVAVAAQNPVTIDVATVENRVSGGIYGACIEDVNHEIYGGLYDQKIFGESFEEDYQNMTFSRFETFGGNWAGTPAQVSVSANDGAKLLFETPFADGSVEVEIKFSNPRESAALIVRTSNAQTGADNFDGYEIGLNALTSEIILGKHVHNWQPLGNTFAAFNPDEWTKLRVELAGARIRIYVNDATTPNVDYTDGNAPLLHGKIGIRTWRSDVSFRNLRVKTSEDWENIAFDGIVNTLGTWDVVCENAEAQFSTDTINAFNGLRAAKIIYSSGAGKAGLINGGLNRWGIAVQNGKTYDGRIYLRSQNFSGKVYVALQSADGQSLYAAQELENIGETWTKFPFSLISNAMDNNARFSVWIENAGTVWLDQTVLESPAEDRFHNLPYRADIGDAMVAQGLTFLRYGGTMVNAAEYRFKKMIGNTDMRPPYRGHWYPYSSNGFGIEDFLKFCEAAGFEAAFAINIEETAQDAADMVEYLNGDISTFWGAKRAENGHSEPYNVKYIEIGNEEVLFNGDVTAEYTHYIERFLDLYEAMKAKDPNLKFINAAWWRPESANCKRVFDALNGKADYWDYHEWTDELSSGRTVETELQKMQNLFKQWNTNTNMKCAIFEENGNTHNLQRAIVHAAVLNAVRRMSDFVLTSCAANALQPYLQNDNGWDQGQIFFTPDKVWGQPTYYAQQMAAANDLPLRVKQTSRGLRLDVTTTTDENRQSLVIHAVNTTAGAIGQNFVLQNFNAAQTAQITVLQGNPSDENTPSEPEKIIPQTSHIAITDGGFTNVFPPYSYTIIRVEQNETAINEINIKKTAVFRNGENFVLTYPESTKNISLYDISGRELANVSAKPYLYNFPVAGIPDGCYIFQFSGDRKEVVKVIK
jgi:alpha-L-arabinofuranosidase